jgi:hypothetical protein
VFDRSFLPAARLEFVVVTDTHYMRDPGPRQLEFEMRRLQPARAEHALRQIAALEPAFTVHLGDLVQEFPASPDFAQAVDEALAQIERSGITEMRQVAGNHDVGDKPDPTMPTDWVTAKALAAYDARFGSSWYAWDAAGCHFIVLNSQIMNGSLAAVQAQRQWLENDLAANGDHPTFIFLHLAPFLVDEHEPGLGHYDNIDEPARSWLLELARTHDVRAIFAGHSHFAFFNRVGGARSFVVPSTSFTRPGFSQVFSSGPLPARGRDDTPKLGFFLVRVQEDGPRVHFIRTSGAIGPIDESAGARAVTRAPRDLPRSPLGVTLRHPVTSATDVPIAWPSSIRQPVRNDYPLLALQELGVRHLRVPASDLANPLQRARLAMLKDEGIGITATMIWSERLDISALIACHRDLLNGVELQMPNDVLPGEACLRTIATVSALNMAVAISPLLPREIVGGKQHPRTRFGYHVDELVTLDNYLAQHDARVDRVLCRVEHAQRPWDVMLTRRQLPPLNQIGAVDWAVELSASDDRTQTNRAVEAIFAAALDPASRVYLEPLIELDRTMDILLGLLDRLCNPRPVFRAVQTLNTMLFSNPGNWTPEAGPTVDGAMVFGLRGAESSLCLIVPAGTQPEASIPSVDLEEITADAPTTRIVSLEQGVIRSQPLVEAKKFNIQEATLLIAKRSAP